MVKRKGKRRVAKRKVAKSSKRASSGSGYDKSKEFGM